MSSQESRKLWCFVEDQEKTFCISNISLGTSVYELKEAIRQRIEYLHHIDIDSLKLRKLNNTWTVPIEPDHSLADRVLKLGDIVKCSKVLSLAEKVEILFPAPHSNNHLHMVVQILAPSNSSACRKRVRSPAEEDGRAVKRKIAETQGFEMGDFLDTQSRCIAINEAIKAMPDDLDLSSPSTYTMLPFPSLLKPTARFKTKEIDSIDRFEYMGRSRFQELRKRVEEKMFLDARESLCLYGTSGSGKSHLLATLVYHLIRQGKRVVYIPNCLALLLTPAKTVSTALIFAFYDSPAHLETIRNLHRDVDALIRFMRRYKDLYIIVDQVDVFDIGLNDSHKQRKEQVITWHGALKFDSHYIFSTSANENSTREVYRKQCRTSVFPMFGGMNKDETDHWFAHHDHQIPELSAKQRQRVEYITGCIPLLLSPLINIKQFVEPEYRKIDILCSVKSEVSKFFRDKLASLNYLSKETYLTIMSECVWGFHVTSEDQDLIDFRYFYVDENTIGHFTCGIAMEAMVSLLLQRQDNSQFLDGVWYTAVSRCRNPIVQAFLAEQICLSHIANNGLRVAQTSLGRMSIMQFGQQPVEID